MKTLTTHYEVLGVGRKASPESLRQAYRVMARRYHPDVNNDPRAHETMARINEAFATLSDDERRSEYDAAISGGTFANQPPPTQDAVRTNPKKPIVVKLRSRLEGHSTPIYACTFEPTSGFLVSSAFDNEVLWWNPDTGLIEKRMKIEAGVVSTLQPTGEVVMAAGASESTVAYWRVRNGKVEGWRSVNDEWVSAVAVSPDGTSIATGSLHRKLTSWSTEDGHLLYQRDEFSDHVTAICFSNDSELIATGTADASVKLFHALTGAPLQSIRGVRAMVSSLAFSPNNRYLAVAAVDLSIRVFNLHDGALVKIMFGHTKPIESLAFHPNSWLLASGSRDGTVGLWNAAEGIGNVRIDCSTRPISSVAFSADGKLLGAGAQDKKMRLWDVTARRTQETAQA